MPGFSFRYIRYCAFSSSHLIVNDREKWAYIVHDTGIVVSSEIALESVDYQRAIEIFEDVLTEIYIENELMEFDRKQRADYGAPSTGESFYEFIRKFKHHGYHRQP